MMTADVVGSGSGLILAVSTINELIETLFREAGASGSKSGMVKLAKKLGFEALFEAFR